MAQESLSYAKALSEARQVIVQQQMRIKADAEKIKQQQQTIVDQSAGLVAGERRTAEQAGEILQLAEELKTALTRLAETTAAREQADAVVDRQGQRITSLQEAVIELEARSSEQATQIAT